MTPRRTPPSSALTLNVASAVGHRYEEFDRRFITFGRCAECGSVACSIRRSTMTPSMLRTSRSLNTTPRGTIRPGLDGDLSGQSAPHGRHAADDPLTHLVPSSVLARLFEARLRPAPQPTGVAIE